MLSDTFDPAPVPVRYLACRRLIWIIVVIVAPPGRAVMARSHAPVYVLSPIRPCHPGVAILFFTSGTPAESIILEKKVRQQRQEMHLPA